MLRKKSSGVIDHRWRTYGIGRTHDFASHGAFGSLKQQAQICKDHSYLGSFEERPFGQHPDQRHGEASKDHPADSTKPAHCLAGLRFASYSVSAHKQNGLRMSTGERRWELGFAQ